MILKQIVFCLASFVALSAGAHDKGYYFSNPDALQKAIMLCPNTQPKDLSCAELNSIAFEMNKFAEELQRDPLAFGQEILTLQERIATAVPLSENLLHDQDILRNRLAVIRWLESPGSK